MIELIHSFELHSFFFSSHEINFDENRTGNAVFGRDEISLKFQSINRFLLDTLFSSTNQQNDLFDAFPAPLSDRLPVSRI